MRKFIFSCLLIFPIVVFSQNIEFELNKIVKHSLKELPYRGFSSEFTVLFDTIQNNYVFVSEGRISEQIASDISDKISNNLKTINGHTKFKGVFRFDAYTDGIYVQTKEYSTDQIFESVPMHFQPRGGMDKFKRRWVNYLDSLHKNQLFDWKLVPSNTTVRFFVKGGVLIPVKLSPYEDLIADFIKKEKRWQSIHSGRPVSFQVDLETPTYVQKDKTIQHRFHEAVNVFALEKQIFIHADLNSSAIDMNIVSFINNDGLLENPIIHRGNLKECKAIIEALSKMSMPKFLTVDASQFSRIYYYTLNN
ncbi:hypothetical protein [Sphingobacterium hungaricum]|uniref:Uncharacterized protein n=1 Tax=Sphingobacterium hungaricum TaxID=2082723 RepID=A0A928UZ18_9SPHI|nr:hypothetical protein [Sphingobacterium hungaricum]MBE8713432.1 hypothetical protein [Sphingobacterium hungaricum]